MSRAPGGTDAALTDSVSEDVAVVPRQRLVWVPAQAWETAVRGGDVAECQRLMGEGLGASDAGFLFSLAACTAPERTRDALMALLAARCDARALDEAWHAHRRGREWEVLERMGAVLEPNRLATLLDGTPARARQRVPRATARVDAWRLAARLPAAEAGRRARL